MIDAGLAEALNDSINRMANGASVADCLRFYPQYAAALAPLLEAGQLIHRAHDLTLEEAQEAQARGRLRYEQALNTPPVLFPWQRLLRLAASLILLFGFMAGGGAGLLAENSLPGDALYNLKRITETVRLALSGSDPALQAVFDQRRLDEARQIVTLGRETTLAFTGVIDSVTDDILVVAGLPVMTDALAAERVMLAVGQRVEVEAVSTAQGRLIARQIRPIGEPPQADLTPPTISPPARPSATATPHPTREDVLTRPAQTPFLPEPTATSSRSDQEQPAQAADCQAQPPSGWAAYTIQAGDTLSGLATRSGGSLAEVAAVNCIIDTRMIITGQSIYLPRPPAHPTLPPAATLLAPTRDAPAYEAEQERPPSPEREDAPTRSPGRARQEPTPEPEQQGTREEDNPREGSR